MSALDKSLDEMIAERPKNGRRSSRRGGRAGDGAAPSAGSAARARYSGASPASNAATKKQAATTTTTAAPAKQAPADKIIVSNLPLDVNEAQIKELFSSTVGALKDVTLHYDANGKSKGTANVQFQRKNDGNKAYEQYNGRLIDGKRPMRIEIIVDPGRVAPATLASRVAPATTTTKAVKKAVKEADAAMEGVESTTTGATRGKATRGRGRGRGKKREPRTAKSAADLDAEMEEYTATNTAPPPNSEA